MSRRILATVAVLLTVTACSNSSSDTSSSSSPSATHTGLGSEWASRIQAVSVGAPAICNRVGDKACAEHLTNIAIAVTQLEDAITAAGASKYPRSASLIDEIDDAVDAYTRHECLNDDDANIADSPCPDDASTITAGAKALPYALQADEG